MIAKITDAQQVARARLFPYQVWAAYKHAPSDNWKRALGRTLDLVVANIPKLDATLVKGVYVPDRALGEDVVLVKGHELAE